MNHETTSERVTPEGYSSTVEDYLIYLMHDATYSFVLPGVKGKTVLDFGCGNGYGVKMMTDHGAWVTAVDVSSETILAAGRHYASERASFLTIGSTDENPLPFEDNRFDVVVSFQVIEHVGNTERYLSEIHRVLVPGGRLFLSTPNSRIRLLPFQNPWNRFHLREFDSGDLSRLLGRQFKNIELKGLTLREPWLARELRRTNRNKWVLWPVTNRLVPPGLRRTLLTVMGKLVMRGSRRRKPGTEEGLWPTDDAALVSSARIDRSPSLIAICEKT